MSEMKKIVLVDGHSMINRAFYGVPPLTSSRGVHTNAVFGFFNILFSTIDDEKPSCLMVAFDLKAPTFRHRMYDAYKGTRKPMPAELSEQVPLVKELLKAMGIPVVTKEGWEADDILGTIAKRSESAGFEVCILSGDRDLLQLATDHIFIRMPHTKAGKTTTDIFYSKDVLEKYGVTPAGIIELKALMGDSSDNIPGVPRVGEKTATDLVAKYGNIENLEAHREEITKKALRQTLMDYFDLAIISKKLATIDTDAPLEESPEDMTLGSIFTPEAYELMKELELRAFLGRFDTSSFGGLDPDGAGADKGFAQIIDCDDEAKADEAFEKAQGSEDISLLVSGDCIVIKPFGQEIYRMPFDKNDGIRKTYKDKVGMLLAKEELRILTFDLKKELHILGIDAEYRKGVYDLMIMTYLINPLIGVYSLKSEDICRQAAELEEDFEERYETLKDMGMESLFDDIEMPLLFTLYRMENAGVLVRRDELDAYGERLRARIDELEGEIYDLAGESFNINSPKQLGVILFEKLSLPGAKKTKTGYSTAADVLEPLAQKAPIVDRILEYRAMSKLNSTYAVGLSAFIGEDGRIRSSFNQTVTATGRLSSSDPNLQNIPVRTKLGAQLRGVFVPEEGCVFIDADYSQIELRILAAMSGDERLIEAYGQGQDIHAITASQVFHVPFDEVTPQMRRNAKAVNFGIVYGISSFGLSRDLSITRAEAGRYIEDYFKTYPGVESFLKGLVSGAKEKGYVTTLYGRRRPVPELKTGNFMQKQFGERVAMNAPVQGTAADIMKLAMLGVERRLRREKLKARLVLQVHDELLVEAPISEKEQAERILYEEMTGAAKLSVELIAEVKNGSSWLEAH